LSSQTIGVEFASKVVKVGSGSRRKRIKLQVGPSLRFRIRSVAQLWDTAGTERFRAVSRSYYRGAAGAILVYDVSSHASFRALPTFLNDARALASPDLAVILAGNKADLLEDSDGDDESLVDAPPGTVPSSVDSRASGFPASQASIASSSTTTTTREGGRRSRATVAPEGREVLAEEATRWASAQGVALAVEVSALSGARVDELFARLAGMILTKIELGEVDPDDPLSGIQYGDNAGAWTGAGTEDAGSIKSALSVADGDAGAGRRRRGGHGSGSALRQWGQVFRLDGRGRRTCC
jgi:GTPase SAR1 family protein